MKIKFGALATSGSGKLGGQYVSAKKGSAVLSTIQVKKSANHKAVIRLQTKFIRVLNVWKSLTVEQKNLWNDAVHNFSEKNSFGDTILLTGKDLFMRLNTSIEMAIAPFILVPPLPVHVNTPEFGSCVFDINESSPSFLINVSPLCPVNQKYVIYATRPLSPGITNANGLHTLFRRVLQNTGTNLQSYNTYTFRYYAPASAGQNIHLRMVAIDLATGCASLPRDLVVTIIKT